MDTRMDITGIDTFGQSIDDDEPDRKVGLILFGLS